jgi:hypothetical protein
MMTKNKKIGVGLIITPLLLLVISMIGGRVLILIIDKFGTSLPVGTFVMLRVALSILGIVGVISICITIPIGIYFLTKESEDPAIQLARLQADERYKSLTPEQINFIHKWSWGAFFGGAIWPLGNKLFIWALLSLIPLVNIYVWIKLAIEGRRMAWEQSGWDDFDHFRYRQKVVAVIIVIIVLLISVKEIFFYDKETKVIDSRQQEQVINESKPDLLKTEDYNTASIEKIKRDSQRLSDLAQLQKTLEFYFINHKVYPAGQGDVLGSVNFACLNSSGFNKLGCSSPYMSIVPSDPLDSQSYIYNSDNISYTIFANLETNIQGLSGAVTVSPSGIRD